MSLASATTVIGLSNLLAGHALIDARPPREVVAALSAGTDLDDSFAPVAFDSASAANAGAESEADRQVLAVAADLALLQTLGRVAAGVSVDQERSLAARVSSGQIGPDAVRLLTECVDSQSAPLSMRRFAILALGALGDEQAVRKALRSGQPALTEAALDAIDWWSLKGFDEELRAVSQGYGAQWLREYAEDLLG